MVGCLQHTTFVSLLERSLHKTTACKNTYKYSILKLNDYGCQNRFISIARLLPTG